MCVFVFLSSRESQQSWCSWWLSIYCREQGVLESFSGWRSWTLFLRLFQCIKKLLNTGSSHDFRKNFKRCQTQIEPPLWSFNPFPCFLEGLKETYENQTKRRVFFLVVFLGFFFPEASGKWEFVKWLTRNAGLFDDDEDSYRIVSLVILLRMVGRRRWVFVCWKMWRRFPAYPFSHNHGSGKLP